MQYTALNGYLRLCVMLHPASLHSVHIYRPSQLDVETPSNRFSHTSPQVRVAIGQTVLLITLQLKLKWVK